MDHASIETQLSQLRAQLASLTAGSATSSIPNSSTVVSSDSTTTPPIDQKSVTILSMSLPRSFPIPRSDQRLYVKLFDKNILALLDTGGQASICGTSDATNIKSISTQFHSFPINVPVNGVGSGTLTATLGISAVFSLSSPSGPLAFLGHFLVCPGHEGVIIGLPDLQANKVSFQDCEKATLHGQLLSTTVAPSQTVSSIRIGKFSVRLSAATSTTLQSPRPTLPASDTLVEAHELLQFSDHPSTAVVPATLPRTPTDFGSVSESQVATSFAHPTLRDHIFQFYSDVRNGETLLTTTQAYTVGFILHRYQRCFVTRLSTVGDLDAPPFSLRSQLKSFSPIRKNPFRLAEPKASLVERALQKDVKDGLRFHPKCDEVVSTVQCFPVFERDKMRLVGNFVSLNDQTKLDPWPCPTTQATLSQLSQSQYRAMFDFKSGYHQTRKDEFTIAWTVWITALALYASAGMDFGLKNAAQHFVRIVHSFYHRYPNIHAHVDDILPSGSTFSKFLQALHTMLQIAEAKRAKFKISKLQIAPKTFRAVGHEFTADVRRPDPKRLQPLKDLAPASTVTQVKSMLGLFVYWREYIPNFQTIAKPLRDMIRAPKGRMIEWTKEAGVALKTLKEIVIGKAALALPNYSTVSIENPFRLYSDASLIARGYMLAQVVHGKRRLLSCGSKALSAVEQRRHINYLELETVPWALEQCERILALQPTRIYFDSRNIEFFIRKSKVKFSLKWSRLAAAYNKYPGLQFEFIRGIRNEMSNIFTRFTDELVDKQTTKMSLISLFPQVCKAAQTFVSKNVSISSVNLSTSPSKAFTNTQTSLEVHSYTFELSKPISRFDVAAASTSLKFPSIAQEQRQSLEYEPIFQSLQDPLHPRHNARSLHYVILDGILYRYSAAPDNLTGKRWLQLCVPPQHRDVIFYDYHVSAIGSHVGFRDTLSRILRSYHWPGIRKWVEDKVKRCNACTRSRMSLPLPAFASPGLPSFATTWAFDFVGPYPRSKEGYNYLLTAIELSTGYPEAFPCRTNSAKEFARVFCYHIVCRYGMPAKILTDWGSHFINEATYYMASLLRISHIKASKGNSRGNSRLERKHRPINQGIIASLIAHQCPKSKWPQFVHPILLTLRTRRPEGKQNSPAELCMGFQPKLPRDAPDVKASGSRDLRSICKDVREFYERIKTLRTVAANDDLEKRLNSSERKQALRLPVIDIGSLVFLHSSQNVDGHTTLGKLDSNWVGPYSVIALVGIHSYLLQHLETNRVTKPIHRRHITPCYEDYSNPAPPKPPANLVPAPPQREAILNEQVPNIRFLPERKRRARDLGPMVTH